MMARHGAILLLCLAGAGPVAGQVDFDPESRLQPTQMRRDLEVFREALEVGHGGLYAYSSASEMAAAFTSIEQRITRPLTEGQFFLALNRAVARIRDGHTLLLESLAHRDWLDAQPTYPPLRMKLVSGRAFTVANFTADPDFQLGEEILAINGRPMGSTLRQMLPHIMGDGRSQTGAHLSLESTPIFGRLHRHLFGSNGRWTYLLRNVDTGGLREVNLRGLELATYRSRARERYGVDRPAMELAWHARTAVLGIHGMVSEVAGVPAREFLAQAFEDVVEGEAERLVIDLRRNGGGVDEVGKHLLAHLVAEPFHYYDGLTMRSNETPYARYTNEDPTELEAMITALRPRSDGAFDVVTHPNVGLQDPATPYFDGDLIVLIGPRTFSAATEAVAALRTHTDALLVGSETGGSAVANTSGYTVQVELPNSAIRLVVPLHRYHQAGGSERGLTDRGFLPDYVIEPSISERIRGDDPALAFALRIDRSRLEHRR